MNSDETIQQRQQRLSRVPRACDACKIRKIRCDRANPCSNCQASSISCRNGHYSLRPNAPENPPRVADLRKEVDHLRARISNIELQIASQPWAPETTPSVTLGAPIPQAVSQPLTPSVDHVYDGASSFASQSHKASEAVQSSYDVLTAGDQCTLKAPFTNLASLLEQDSMASSAADCQFSVTSPQRPMPQLKPLPLALVAAVCRQAKARNSVFLSSYLISDPNDFEDLCRKIYFPTTPISLGDITTMHGILAYLLREHIAFQEPLPKEFDVTDHLRQCDKNFDVAIETYDILAIPAFENIFALSLGIMKAQGLSKPTLCCSLLSAASSQCRILGYCREGIYKNLSTKTASQMRRVFWSVYILDKNISLIHGRPSYLQDFEIDTLYPKASTDPKRRPWDESFIMAIKFATIQGLIYRHCYSKDAAMYTIPERELRITELSVDLKEWYSKFKQIDYSLVNNTQIFKLSRINWDVMYYSTLTLLLRPIPSSDGRGYVSSQCFEAARSSLQSHLLCFSAYPNQQNLTISKADYADWILHLSSFTPFIVVFLHSIAAKSEEDVHLLNQVVETLRSINSVSKATERLYKICAALAQVANAIVESGAIRVEGYDKVQDSLHFINNLDHIIMYNDHMENGLLLQDPEELAGVVHDWVVGESPSWW